MVQNISPELRYNERLKFGTAGKQFNATRLDLGSYLQCITMF